MSLPYISCSVAGGLILSQLLDWMRLHFTEGMRLAKEAMQDERPDAHPSYWPAVCNSVSCISISGIMLCVITMCIYYYSES